MVKKKFQHKVDYLILVGFILLATTVTNNWYKAVFPIDEINSYPVYKGYDIVIENFYIVFLYLACIVIQFLIAKCPKLSFISSLSLLFLGITLFFIPVFFIYDLSISTLFFLKADFFIVITQFCIPSFGIGMYINFAIITFLVMCNIFRCFIFRK